MSHRSLFSYITMLDAVYASIDELMCYTEYILKQLFALALNDDGYLVNGLMVFSRNSGFMKNLHNFYMFDKGMSVPEFTARATLVFKLNSLVFSRFIEVLYSSSCNLGGVSGAGLVAVARASSEAMTIIEKTDLLAIWLFYKGCNDVLLRIPEDRTIDMIVAQSKYGDIDPINTGIISFLIDNRCFE